jgi:tripartite-type tricarboxylate transporter receptor subunit TctC
VRSFAQQGFGDFEAPTWWAFLGRAGTPEPILRRMHEALTQALAEPEIRSRIEEQGCDVVAGSPAECGRFLVAEIEKWGQGDPREQHPDGQLTPVQRTGARHG